ncbi:fungal-specific transcription factor domain-containing protein [Aspergillus californicus]
MPRQIAPGRSCLECRRRKIKCDRSHPCSYCVKVRIQCKYPPRPGSNDEDPLRRVASLETKLLAVERRLAEIGDSSGMHRETHSHVNEPLKPPSADNPASILSPQPPIDLNTIRPSRATIALLWQHYLEAVDPLLKIFHTPTVQKLVMTAIHGREMLDSPSECLLFAIYYGSVASMSPEGCILQLETERRFLLKQFQTGVEHLLSRLSLLEAKDMTVLQAFAIYLITGRCDEQGPDVYALVGLAVGMALKMGLNKDGEAVGLSPFEVEMRRRLWWQLFILDIRVAEDRGSDPCILESSFNTRLPSNISDVNLHPMMAQTPVCGPGRTEMLFSLVRFEGSYFARQMVFSDSFDEANSHTPLSTDQKGHAIDLFEERINKQYLSHLDDKVPLDNVTAQSFKILVGKLRLTATDSTRTYNCALDTANDRKAWFNDHWRLSGYI